MICKLRKNNYQKIELLFCEQQYNSYYQSHVYELNGFKQVDSVSFNLDFYNQFLQEETEEDAKKWCLIEVERIIFEHLYKKYKSEIDAENEESEDEDEKAISPPKKITDFFDDYKDLSECFNELKEYSESVMHNIWECRKTNEKISKTVFKLGQKFSIVRGVVIVRSSSCEYKNCTFNLFPEMYSDIHFYVSDKYNSESNFFISEISRFDSTSYKLELSMNKEYGTGAIIEKLKFIVQKGDVLAFKYYQKGEKTYFVNATVINIKNNEIELDFGLFDENCLL